MIVRVAHVVGQLGGHEIGMSLTVGPETPEEMQEVAIENAIKGMERQYPGVRDVHQVGGWIEQELPIEEKRSVIKEWMLCDGCGRLKISPLHWWLRVTGWCTKEGWL